MNSNPATVPASSRSVGRPRRRRVFALGVALLVLAGACGDDDDSESAPTSPAAVIEEYRIAYNARDIEAIMDLFAEDAVVTGHPDADASGWDEVRTVQMNDLDSAADEDAYEFSNVAATGDTVTWDYRWVSSSGQYYCGEGQRVVVTDAKIVTWTWPADRPLPCP